jgi:hypothetical protein
METSSELSVVGRVARRTPLGSNVLLWRIRTPEMRTPQYAKSTPFELSVLLCTPSPTTYIPKNLPLALKTVKIFACGAKNHPIF